MRSLSKRHRLPENWSEPAFVEDTIVADGIELWRSGVASVGPNGEEITGSAAARGASPDGRSYYELLERVSVLCAVAAGWTSFPETSEPARWRYARSNGVALFHNWEEACRRARWELIERDRVLRSWYGESLPERLSSQSSALVSSSYDYRAYRFPAPHAWSLGRDEVEVVGVFGFPVRPELPFVLGYAARDDIGAARAAAEAEALQLLAFLWGEPLPKERPPVAPHAMAHLDWLLWPGRRAALERWLAGEHAAHAVPVAPSASDLQLDDITPNWLAGELFVVRATSPSALPLTFGDAPFAAHLPYELRIHPIP